MINAQLYFSVLLKLWLLHIRMIMVNNVILTTHTVMLNNLKYNYNN